MADLMDEAIEISHKLIPCNICGRTFLPSPLKKHAKVCEKNATRKRKTFNSLKQRIEGTELAVFHQKSFLRKNEHLAAPAVAPSAPPAQIEEKRKQSKWKEKHEQLVRAIRAAKGEKVMAPRRSISAVGSMGTTEQCPTCDRHFGPKAYDRHVEWCKEHKIRASKSPAVVTIAKERLEARTKYRVPPLGKSKRSVTRDKYSSPSPSSLNRNRDALMNTRSTSSLEPPPTNTRKLKHPRNTPTQNHAPSLIEPVIVKPNVEKLKSIINHPEKDDYDPFVIAEKQLMELLQGDDFKPYKNTNKPTKTHPNPKQKCATPNDFHTKLNTLQDNFEIIENLINDNFTSTKRKFSDEINAIDPKLINENDNLTIPDKLTVDRNYSPIAYNNNNNNNDVDDYSAQYDKNISILEPLVLPKTEMNRHLTDAEFDVFISSFDDDADDDGLPTLKRLLNATPHTKKKTLNYSSGKCVDNKKHPLSPLKRSVSLLNPVVKARSMRNKQDIQDYLHVRGQKPSRDNKLKALSPRSSDELFPVEHDMYSEYKKYEEMYRRERGEAPEPEENDCDSSNEEDSTPPLPERNYQGQQQHLLKMQAGDSAYGSLNRKSPKVQQVPQHARPSKAQHAKRSPSSSGSETCTSLPAKKAGNRLTKFCHECGTKYPLDCAKFCVECGIKRLVL